jgi:hypothetical protein
VVDRDPGPDVLPPMDRSSALDHLDPVAPEPRESPEHPKARWEARIQPDGSVVIPAELISPVMSMVGSWWSGQTGSAEFIPHAPNAPLKPVDRNLVSVSEFARLVDVAESTVWVWIQRGLPSTKAQGLGRRILRAQAEAWLIAGGPERSRTAKKLAKGKRPGGSRG